MNSSIKFTPVVSRVPLTFGLTNAKLAEQGIATFSLPAGETCPGACECLARFDRVKKRIIDGPKTKHRCYAATLEAARKSLRDSVDRNLAALRRAKTAANMAQLLDMSLPARHWHTVRVHSDGDFFNATYFRAWLAVARANPDRNFYAYTKSLPSWIKWRAEIPPNFLLTASEGGKFDHLITEHNLRSAVVVLHPKVAELMGLEIDHHDLLPRDSSVQRFALLIHGQQPKGSEAAAALLVLKKEKIPYAYGKKSPKHELPIPNLGETRSKLVIP